MIDLLLQAEGALSVGLLDRAETLYRQVVRADPRNSIAVVGLARVALERRNEREALALARQALAIDPENTAANRMVLRLEEVLAFRGVEVPDAGGPGGPVRPSSDGPVRPTPAEEPPAMEAPAPAVTEAPAAAVSAQRRSFIQRLLRRR